MTTVDRTVEVEKTVEIETGVRTARVACAAGCGDALLYCAGAGVMQASLISLLASADAFSARLQYATQQTAQLQMLQLQSLSTSIADLQRAPARAAVAAAATHVSPPRERLYEYGAPVVT